MAPERASRQAPRTSTIGASRRPGRWRLTRDTGGAVQVSRSDRHSEAPDFKLNQNVGPGPSDGCELE